MDNSNVPEGFIPLIEYEIKFKERLLISFPGFCHRKEDILMKNNKFYKIEKTGLDYALYGSPKLTEINNGQD